jgi:hypothetical protein
MTADLPTNVHIIDYAFSAGGVFYHGTISDFRGVPKSTWTISVGEKKTQTDVPIDQDTFAFLWNGIGDYSFFKKSLVTSPDTRLDFYKYQVIGIMFSQDGQRKGGTYLRAPTETNPQYKAWIEKLHVPIVKPGE